MKNILNIERTLTTIVVVVIIGLIFFIIHMLEYDSGYYCEYCGKGSFRHKSEVIHEYGNKPCPVANDSIHNFIWYYTAPKYKVKPKYVK